MDHAKGERTAMAAEHQRGVILDFLRESKLGTEPERLTIHYEVVVAGFDRHMQAEVAHYFQYEDRLRGCGLETGSGGGDPIPPSFPAGADYWTCMTVIDRLKAADRLMPPRYPVVSLKAPEIGKCGAAPVQQIRRDESPSCSAVLKAAYGDKAHKYKLECGRRGEELRQMACRAYVEAAAEVPARDRAGRRRRAADALWERTFEAS